jgi:polyisoprenoid-binding protein YceI
MKLKSAMRIAALPLTLIAFASLIFAQSKPIDTKQSKVTVRVFKSGLFSAFAHDHTIEAPIAAGSIDTAARTVQLSFHAQDMKVMDPGTSDKDKVEIERTMKGEKVLDAERYPEIVFNSTAVEARDATHFNARGDLSLHGTTRPIEMLVKFDGGRYTGSVKLKQTEFGIKPVNIAGGTVKVKDEVEILVEIVPGA